MIRRSLPKIMRSYGCQLGVFDYLSELEVLQLQLIDRDTYGRTIARCQYTFHLPEIIAFTFPTGFKLTKCIMLLNGVGGEPQKLDHQSLDFNSTKTVVVKKELFAFKGGSPVSVYKIANFTYNDHLVIPFSTLPRNEKLDNFDVTYWAASGSIVLTGGKGSERKSAETFMMDVQTGMW